LSTIIFSFLRFSAFFTAICHVRQLIGYRAQFAAALKSQNLLMPPQIKVLFQKFKDTECMQDLMHPAQFYELHLKIHK